MMIGQTSCHISGFPDELARVGLAKRKAPDLIIAVVLSVRVRRRFITTLTSTASQLRHQWIVVDGLVNEGCDGPFSCGASWT
jgi:hypothetical protein